MTGVRADPEFQCIMHRVGVLRAIAGKMKEFKEIFVETYLSERRRGQGPASVWKGMVGKLDWGFGGYLVQQWGPGRHSTSGGLSYNML